MPSKKYKSSKDIGEKGKATYKANQDKYLTATAAATTPKERKKVEHTFSKLREKKNERTNRVESVRKRAHSK